VLRALAGLLALALTACEPRSTDRNTGPILDSAGVALRLTGRHLDSASFTTTAGRDSTLHFYGSGPAVLFVLEKSDCWSCVRIVADSWKAQRWAAAHRGRVLGFVISDSLEPILAYTHANRLPFDLLVDRSAAFAGRVGLLRHPLVVVLSPSGRIMAVLHRTAATQETVELAAYLEELGPASQ